MKRVALAGSVTLVSGLLLAACLPRIPGLLPINLSSPTPAPNQKPTPEFSTTPTSTLFIDSSSTPTFFPTRIFTPIPSFTSTIGSPGTTIPLSLTAIVITDTATPAESGSIDELPSITIYKPVHIHNSSGTQVDISLHCTTKKGLQAILEYNNIRNVFTMLPEGNYVYVVYVGGRQVVGGFSFLTAQKLFIAVYKDRVVIH